MGAFGHLVRPMTDLKASLICIVFAVLILTGCENGQVMPAQRSQPKARSMTFTVYIERENSEITLENWRNLVATTADLRIAKSDLVTTNPATNEEIRIKNNGGDTEWRNVDSEEWERRFYWAESGRIYFSTADYFEDRSNVLRQKARELAEKLNAVVVDEYGQEYD